MPTIAVQVTVGTQTAGRVRTVSGPHLLRFIAAYKAWTGMTDLTDQQVFESWADRCIDQARTIVRQHEEQQARETALSGITDIGIM